MQLISVLKKEFQSKDSSNNGANEVVYRTYHSRNGSFLEKEDDGGKFQILRYVDDCSKTALMTTPEILKLIEDVEIVIDESKNDNEICNHLKEIIFLCKLCVWNDEDFYLEISPWGADLNTYPSDLPEQYRFNISSL